MSYRKIKLLDLHKEFKITNQLTDLFKDIDIQPLDISKGLKRDLKRADKIQPKSEKAKSEFIIAPVLVDIMERNNDFFKIYSGDNLSADVEKGLNGEVDFLLAYNTESYSFNTPLITVVEAKKGDIELGVDQCAAQMYGAQIFNQKMGTPVSVIYGCVTTADDWLFLKLEDKQLWIDRKKYYLGQLSHLLGVWQWIIDFYKKEIPTPALATQE